MSRMVIASIGKIIITRNEHIVNDLSFQGGSNVQYPKENSSKLDETPAHQVPISDAKTVKAGC